MTATAEVADVTTAKLQEHIALWGTVNGRPLQIPIIGVTGSKGSGKTLFVGTIDTENTGFVDLEDSAVTYNLPFAKHWSLYEEMAAKDPNAVPKAIDRFIWFRDTVIGGIQPGELKVLAVDPLNDIEAGLVDWVQSNPEYFGHTRNQYEKASGIMWGDVKSYWKTLLGVLSKKVETFAFTTHMGLVFKGGAPVPGKMKAKGKDTLYELASLYLHLERKPDAKGNIPAAPIGSIVPPIGKSRLAHTSIANGIVEIVPILPPRIIDCTPQKIREYIAKPPDYKKLKKSELAQEDRLSDDDKLEMEREIAESNRQTEELRSSRLDRMTETAKANAARQSASKSVAAGEQVADRSVPTSTPSNGEASTSESAEPELLIYNVLRQQRIDLDIPREDWKAILAKRRGSTEVTDLTIDEAAELQRAMWTKLTARDMDKTAGN
jgi:hypothetical protein